MNKLFLCRILERISEMLDMLLNNKDMVIAEFISEDSEEFETPPHKIHGCVLTLVERLDEEFTKLLKECDRST